MRRVTALVVLSVLSLAGVWATARASQSQAPDVDAAFERFFAASDPASAERLVGDVVATGVGFNEAYARLTQGRRYTDAVPRGLRRPTRRTSDGLEHSYAVVVPDDYDPARAYQVRVQLHGGIGRPEPRPGREGIDRLPASTAGPAGNAENAEIGVYPNGWADAMWWHANQVENLAGILDELKRTYNVDENRVYLTGISDGATGAFFVAFRDTTPWASFLPLNGHMMVLANPDTGADGQLYPGNAVNKPFFIVNGGKDRLYPTRSVEPFVEHLQEIGTRVVYHPRPEAGHNTEWWPDERASFEAFVRDHPRDPLPDTLTWETERTDRYGRAHWLVIDELGRVDGESDLEETNLITLGLMRRDIFSHRKASGRADVVRRGNRVEVATEGVRELTLLLSPEEFDFATPVTVVANGRVAFEGRLTPSVETLLRWASRDNDRTMLFAAEQTIVIGD